MSTQTVRELPIRPNKRGNMLTSNKIVFIAIVLVVAFLGHGGTAYGGGGRVYELIADKDNTFKVVGQKKATITVKAGEVVRLRITAHKGTEWEKDGSVHSFTINKLKDQGWDLRLKDGTQEFTLVAPSEPGEYVVECTIKCGDGHDDMKMKLIVTP